MITIITNIIKILNREKNQMNSHETNFDFDVLDNTRLDLQMMLILDWFTMVY